MVLGIVMLTNASVYGYNEYYEYGGFTFDDARGGLTTTAVHPLLDFFSDIGKGLLGTLAIIGIIIGSKINRINF